MSNVVRALILRLASEVTGFTDVKNGNSWNGVGSITDHNNVFTDTVHAESDIDTINRTELVCDGAAL